MIRFCDRSVFGVCMGLVRYGIVRGATNTFLWSVSLICVVCFGSFSRCLATTSFRMVEFAGSVSVVWPRSDLSESGVVPSVPYTKQVSKRFLPIDCGLSCVWPSRKGVGSECASWWADIL